MKVHGHGTRAPASRGVLRDRVHAAHDSATPAPHSRPHEDGQRSPDLPADSPVVKGKSANGSATAYTPHELRLTKHTLKPYTVHTPIHIIIDSAVYHRDHAAPQTANKQQRTSATHAHSAAVLACPSCVRFALNCAHTTCKCASLPVFYPVRVSTAHSPVITLPMTRCPSNASARL